MSWILAALIAAACSRQESGWERARREDSLAAYEDYLARFPAGPHAGEARAALDGMHDTEAWSRAERLATPEAWQRYLGEFPDGRHAAGARQRLIDFIPPGPQPVDGRYVVQLGAYSTEAAARADLARAAVAHAGTLAGIGLRVIAPRHPRIRSGGCGPMPSSRHRHGTSARGSGREASTACRCPTIQPEIRRHSARPMSRAWSASPNRFRLVRMTPSVKRVRFE